MSTSKRYSVGRKVEILREHLEYRMAVLQLAFSAPFLLSCVWPR